MKMSRVNPEKRFVYLYMWEDDNTPHVYVGDTAKQGNVTRICDFVRDAVDSGMECTIELRSTPTDTLGKFDTLNVSKYHY